jgi:hypothetical protein
MANTIMYGKRTVTLIPDGSANFDITAIQAPVLELNTVVGTFTVGETVTQATSGATGVVRKWDPVALKLHLTQMTGTFDITHVVTGGSSTAHGIPTAVPVAFLNGLRLSAVRFTPSMGNDTLIVRGRGLATGPVMLSLIAVAGADEDKMVALRSVREKPYILASEQSWNTPANVRVMFEYD